MKLDPALRRLLDLPERERSERGLEHTPVEIARQPELWRRTARLLSPRADEVAEYLARHQVLATGPGRLILTGAGTSAFVGACVAGSLRRRLAVDVLAVPTTDLVTHARDAAVVGRPHVLVSFARSGNSPESLATLDAVRKCVGGLGHVIVTCNAEGRLARAAEPGRDLVILMPPESDDRGLAMTSSFTCMALGGLFLGGWQRPEEFIAETEAAAAAAESLLAEHVSAIASVAERPFTRAVFLGAGPLLGCARECALKLQEMTNGVVMCHAESFLGLRHGPQAVVDDDTVVVALMSAEPATAPYEADMLSELKAKGQGARVLGVGQGLCPDVADACHLVVDLGGAPPVAPEFRPVAYVLAGQLLGLLKSVGLGLRPDSPSPSGVINRVVQGMRIHDT